jgi:AraC family transcriptional regulator, regulatory protein of adaptative response / methylated-DNA-[protein]-cysteine methyltransferase
MTEKETIHVALRRCSLGVALVATSRNGVCALLLGDHAEELNAELRRRFPRACFVEAEAADNLAAEAVALIETPQSSVGFPIDARGTEFQRRVWRALQSIPPGSSASYAEIAHRIGAPRATRAVAGACAANPVAVAIPCHRVLRSDGALSGYRWGVARKRALLAREGCRC